MRSALLIISLAIGCSAAPPPKAPAAAPPGCDAPEYHRLDFWLGEWDVKDAHGALLGTNVVSRTLRGCAIEEKWTDAEGHGGQSLFYFDRGLGLWKQVWVTEEGSFKEKREVPGSAVVVFSGERDRTTLEPLDGGRVRQRIEAHRGGGSWEGIY